MSRESLLSILDNMKDRMICLENRSKREEIDLDSLKQNMEKIEKTTSEINSITDKLLFSQKESESASSKKTAATSRTKTEPSKGKGGVRGKSSKPLARNKTTANLKSSNTISAMKKTQHTNSSSLTTKPKGNSAMKTSKSVSKIQKEDNKGTPIKQESNKGGTAIKKGLSSTTKTITAKGIPKDGKDAVSEFDKGDTKKKEIKKEDKKGMEKKQEKNVVVKKDNKQNNKKENINVIDNKENDVKNKVNKEAKKETKEKQNKEEKEEIILKKEEPPQKNDIQSNKEVKQEEKKEKSPKKDEEPPKQDVQLKKDENQIKQEDDHPKLEELSKNEEQSPIQEVLSQKDEEQRETNNKPSMQVDEESLKKEKNSPKQEEESQKQEEEPQKQEEETTKKEYVEPKKDEEEREVNNANIKSAIDFLNLNKLFYKPTVDIVTADSSTLKNILSDVINNFKNRLEEIQKSINDLKQSSPENPCSFTEFLPEFVLSEDSKNAIETLNENKYISLFQQAEVPSNEVIMVYRLYLQLINTNKQISTIDSNDLFWKESTNYFINNSNNQLGTFISNQVSSFDLTDENILIISKMIIGYEKILTPSYYSKICPTTELFMSIIKDVLEYTALLSDNQLLPARLHKNLNYENEKYKTLIEEVEKIKGSL